MSKNLKLRLAADILLTIVVVSLALTAGFLSTLPIIFTWIIMAFVTRNTDIK